MKTFVLGLVVVAGKHACIDFILSIKIAYHDVLIE